MGWRFRELDSHFRRSSTGIARIPIFLKCLSCVCEGGFPLFDGRCCPRVQEHMRSFLWTVCPSFLDNLSLHQDSLVNRPTHEAEFLLLQYSGYL